MPLRQRTTNNVNPKDLEGTLTERGQVTVPLSIRKELELVGGDTISFYQTNEGIVFRNSTVKKASTFMNLLYRLVKKENNIVVSGKVGQGKSLLISKLLSGAFKGKRITIFEEGYEGFRNFIKMYLTTEEYRGVEVTEEELNLIYVVNDLDSFTKESLEHLISEESDVVVYTTDFVRGFSKKAEELDFKNMLDNSNTPVISEEFTISDYTGSSCLHLDMVNRVRLDTEYESSLKIGIWSTDELGEVTTYEPLHEGQEGESEEGERN